MSRKKKRVGVLIDKDQLLADILNGIVYENGVFKVSYKDGKSASKDSLFFILNKLKFLQFDYRDDCVLIKLKQGKKI